MPPPLQLSVTCKAGRQFAPMLRRKLRAAHTILKPALRELSVVLVGNREMSRLHQQFMHDPTVTDVLTFPIDHDPGGRVTSGEVVICVPESRRNARRCGTCAADELLLYALHGMLHLCGFDDRTNAEFSRMHRTEDRILVRLGVGAVFEPSRRTRGTR